MISIILPQMPLLSKLFCICLCSYTLIWRRIISHWICVLVPGFVLASFPLFSKCVWLAKFLFGDYCFPSQRSEFAFVFLIFGHLFLPTALAFQLSLFYSVSSGAHRAIRIVFGQKKRRYLEWQTVMGVKIAGLGCGTSLYFPYPKAIVTAPSDATREGRTSRMWGEGAAPSSPLLPQKQKVLPSYPQISPCSSAPALFFQRAKIKFACTSEKPGAFLLMPSDWSIVCSTLFLIFTPPPCSIPIA